jgi:hypothetical protein
MRKYPLLLGGMVLLLTLTLSDVFGREARLTDIRGFSDTRQVLVYAKVTNCFTKEMEQAIFAGIPTTFTFFVNLYEERDFWPDRRVAAVVVRHTLKYDRIRKLYSVSVGDGKEPVAFQELEAAKLAMAELNGVGLYPVGDLKRGRTYYLKLKAKLEEIRLPMRLEYILFFVSLWDFETDWHLHRLSIGS